MFFYWRKKQGKNFIDIEFEDRLISVSVGRLKGTGDDQTKECFEVKNLFFDLYDGATIEDLFSTVMGIANKFSLSYFSNIK